MNIDLQYLVTADNHQIAWASFGDIQNTPLLHIHGGPGSGANAAEASLFNLHRHRVIMFDQRGSGRSLPQGTITHNTTQHLLQDIEQLRDKLGIEQWRIYGGSWGASVALEYAKQYPDRVIDIILRGSFLARQQDLDWFIKPEGIASNLPLDYEKLLAALQPEEGEALTSCLYRRTQHDSLDNAYQAAHAWDCWEASVMNLPAPPPQEDQRARQQNIAKKRVYSHYCHHQFFLGEEGVMTGLSKLKNIPVTLIHGRADMVCPLSAAETLLEALPNGDLIAVDAGHSLHEKAISNALWKIVNS